jgi:hypothetical protein
MIVSGQERVIGKKCVASYGNLRFKWPCSCHGARPFQGLASDRKCGVSENSSIVR